MLYQARVGDFRGIHARFMFSAGAPASRAVQAVVFHPAWSDIEFVSFGETPPTQGQCKLINRRCFNPQSEQNSYNLTPLLTAGDQGQG